MIKRYILLTTILLINVISILYPQGGYKDFSWGDNYKSVRNKTNMLSKQQYNISDYKCLLIPFYIENEDLYKWKSDIPNPINHIDGNVTIFLEENTGRLFFFKDSALFAVRIKLVNMEVLGKLENKYGEVVPKYWHDGYWNYDMRAWLNEPQRIIAYQANSYFDITERVTYIDKTLYLDVSSKLTNERKNQLIEKKEAYEKYQEKSNRMID